jgi:hypothetical protein
MPEKPRSVHQVHIFRPRDYDRELAEHAREAIKLAKRVLAESDPSILLGGWYKPEPPSETSKLGG